MTPHPKTRFKVKGLYRHKQPHAFHYVSKRYSFWVATLTVFTFLIGNMVGQHGWFAFWNSVMGKVDDSTIIFTGTVTPIDKVPDYEVWARYGGDPQNHTYRMVPEQALIPLPVYDSAEQRHDFEHSDIGDIYGVGNLGSYETGAENSGSHVGTDILVPIGTPVRSIANGIVETVRDLNGGFGRYVTIRHPNIPDSSRESGKTVVYSTYAHLDTLLVTEGTVVTKGQQIGTSGKTGFASGPHLHFQIDNEDAPYHPYWPFTSTEASNAGMNFTEAINAGLHRERGVQYTVNPMLFVQTYESSSSNIATQGVTSNDSLAVNPFRALTPQERLEARKSGRLAKIDREQASQPLLASASPDPLPTKDVVSESSSSVSTIIEAVTDAVTPPVLSEPKGETMSSISIDHDGGYRRGWEAVEITALDANGQELRSADFSGVIYLRASFGTAEFRPDRLTSASFKNGKATVYVLPNGNKRALIMEANGSFHAVSSTMEYEN